jgi:V/A-type H+-transporting ATPase subunit C
MAKVSGPAPYPYVCTRLRVRKAKLLPREDYLRILNMGLPEIARFIEETQYKQEIDELAGSFQGIDLIEIALSWNLAKEYQNILKITPGVLKEFTRAYLSRFDIQNVLTILRGKMQGVPAGRIKEILVPAGELDSRFLDRLLDESLPDNIIGALRGSKLYSIVAREYPAAAEHGSLSQMENELYKQFYANLMEDAASGVKGGRQFLEYIRLDIDITNIKNLFRFRSDQLEEDIGDMMIPGSTFSIRELQRLDGIENQDEFIDALMAKIRTKPLLEVLDKLRGDHSVRDAEIELIRFQLDQMDRLSKRHPFSIHPVLAYLERKKYEVINLRAVARGKEADLPPERIREYLVM